MQTRYPYAAPRANVAGAESGDDYGEIKILSASGRLNRVRYIGYTTGLTFLFASVLGIAATLAGPSAAGAVTACLLPLIFVIGIVAAIAIPAYQDYVQRAAEAQSQQ